MKRVHPRNRTTDESGERASLLVLGLGNVLCADDGAGVEAVRRLQGEYEIEERVRVLDGGTLGLTLLHYLGGADRALLVDAIASGDRPGTIVRAEGDQVPVIARQQLSCHQIGVADLLECARMIDVVPDVTLIGIVAASVEPLGEPSPAVTRNIYFLVERVVDEIRALGFTIERRTHDHEENPNRYRNGATDTEFLRWM
jgi:hydrogenase maturation protease